MFFRSVYERADKSLRNVEEKEERVMLLEAWKEFEVFHLCPMPMCYLLPLSRSSHVRARLKRASNRLFRVPVKLPPTQGYWSF